MNADKARELCLKLMQIDSEEEVVDALRAQDLWDNPRLWRFYGDVESNYSNVGNQQSRPDAALVEKVVNSIDARLMNECLEQGLDPEGSEAEGTPQSIREAVGRFFGGGGDPMITGNLRNWNPTKRTEVARGITIAATGPKAQAADYPCFSIADKGEGQHPDDFPRTFLSLPTTRSNKARIPFVQGRFNMGGSGVLQFCGNQNLQLIVSRRNPAIPGRREDNPWGFTIVRREVPEGPSKNSVYSYLAPLGSETVARGGSVLRFSGEPLNIFPEGTDPYSSPSEWGTLIKLYNYKARGFQSNMILPDGLLQRLDLLLPDAALPVRLHECRDYKGKKGSFETTMSGLSVRLDEDKAGNLEEGINPSTAPFRALGEKMTTRIYAFAKGKGKTYRGREGIVFTINGQTHGYLDAQFFTRKRVGLSYLRDDLLVMVDCSNMGTRQREDLFMASRDRLRDDTDLRSEIETSLEDLLGNHPALRELKNKRRRERTEEKLADAKPLAEMLEDIMRNSPTLAQLFLPGKRIKNPFKTKKAKQQEEEFNGKTYPTYFKFKNLEYGKIMGRACNINRRPRVDFETDVKSDYFDRPTDPGESLLVVHEKGADNIHENYSLNLYKGVATLNIKLPESAKVGDDLQFTLLVDDRTQREPFENVLELHVLGAVKKGSGGSDRRKRSPGEGKGDRELPEGIALPNITEVSEDEWNNQEPPFTRETALQVRHAGREAVNGKEKRDIYDFYVNVDNVFLQGEIKEDPDRSDVLKARFVYGLVLLGVALLQEEAGKNGGDDGEEKDIERIVEETAKAVAPVLLPMIEALGGLDEDEVALAVA